MNLPTLPEKHPELVELEERRRAVRQQRHELESTLQGVESELARIAARDDDAKDELAEQLARGQIQRISTPNLPERRDDLRNQLDVVTRSDGKVTQRLVRERERYNKQIVAAFRPAHKAAVQRIAKAVEELVAANEAERQLREASPVQLVALAFPNTGRFDATGGPAKHWREYALRIFPDLLEPDEPQAEPKPRLVPRRTRSKANVANAESVPMVAAAKD